MGWHWRVVTLSEVQLSAGINVS